MDPNFNAMLFTRHSIRKYKDEPLDQNSVKQILEAALLAPSSKSSRPWQFVLVDDKDMLAKLAECKPMGALPIGRATLAVAICADPEKSEAWIEDCAVAASFMQLQAHALGIGSCWVQIRDRFTADNEPSQDLVNNLLGIPHSMQVPIVITLGISDENRKPVDPAKLQWEKVHIGAWTDRE